MAQCSQKIRHFSVSLIFILFLALFFESVAPNVVVKLVRRNRKDQTKTDLEELINQGYKIAGMAENRSDLLFTLVKKEDGTQAETHAENGSNALVEFVPGESDNQTKAYLALWIDQGYDIVGMANNCSEHPPKLAKNCSAQLLFALVKKEDGTQAEAADGTNESKAVVQLELSERNDERTKKDLANWINQGYEIAGMAKHCSGKLLFALVNKNSTKVKAHGTNESKTEVLFLSDEDFDKAKRTLEYLINKKGFEIAGVAKTGETIHSLWPQPIYMWILVKIEEVNSEMIEKQEDKQIGIVNPKTEAATSSRGVAKLFCLGQQFPKKRGN